jgi:hypothetical protein
MLDGTTIESVSPEELNSISLKNILLFLPSNLAAVQNLYSWWARGVIKFLKSKL